MEGKTACMWSTVSHKDILAPPPLPLPLPPRCDKRGSRPALHFLPLTPPPPPPCPSLDYGQILAASPKAKDGLHFGDCEYDSWIRTATAIMYEFRLSDRTLRSRDRIFKFSQEIVKICAAAENLDTRVNLAGRAGTTSRERRRQ